MYLWIVKSFFSIILILIYSLSSTGATVYYHKCAEDLSLSFLRDNNQPFHNHLCMLDHEDHDLPLSSSCCAEDDESCEDIALNIEKITAKVIQANPTNLVQYLVPFTFIIQWITNYNFQVKTVLIPPHILKTASYINHSPPDLYIIHNIFRI